MRELDEHARYLRDAARLDAYRRALDAVVRPGDVVLDLGAGTGILGLLARRAGAARVYAVDRGPILAVAERIAARNGVDGITWVRGQSNGVDLPEPVDVVVADQLDPAGLRAGLLESFGDVRARLLAPGGRAVPGSVRVLVAPVTADAARDDLDFWRSRPEGFDVSDVAELAANQVDWRRIEADDLLGEPVASGPVDTLHASGDVVATGVVACRAGRVDGLGLWFEASLAPGVALTNGPGAPAAVDRGQALLPLADPIQVAEGDELTVDVRLGSVVTWSASPPGEAPRRHSSVLGLFLGADDLARRLPGYRPGLGYRGRVVAHVLAGCAAGASVDELRRSTRETFVDIEARGHDVDDLVDWIVDELAR